MRWELAERERLVAPIVPRAVFSNHSVAPGYNLVSRFAGGPVEVSAKGSMK
jgi:hypothetical protein